MNTYQKPASGRKTALRAASLLLCALMLIGVFSSCSKSKKNPKAETEGFVFSGDAYTADGIADLPEALSSVTVTANNDRSAIIPTDAVFTIKTAGATDVETLTKYLTVKPAVAFTVSSVSGSEFLLTPRAGSLDAGRVYSFTVGDPDNPVSSYAFQTENELIVRSVLPADLAVGVPLNTGIEIAFTEVVRNAKLEDYITISPKTAGRFELYPDGRTVVFVPDKNLSVNTVYTVEVKSGLTSFSGKKLENDFSAKFRTGSEAKSNGGDRLEIYTDVSETIYSPGEYPTIYYTLYGSNNIAPKHNDVAATVWRYGGADDAIEAMKAYEAVRADYLFSDKSYEFPTKGLVKVGSYNITPSNKDSGGYSSRMYFSLPQLEAGIYLVNYVISGSWNGKQYQKNVQIMVQVTNLRVHTESCDGSTLFWVNRAPGGPVSGAQLTADCFDRLDLWNTEGGKTAYTTLTGATDGSGVSIIKNGERNSAYVKVAAGGEETIVPLLANADTEQKYFCKYIFSDREVYFSDDTVKYYGVIAPGGEETLPARLYVYVGSIPYGTVALAGDGSFSGGIPIESYAGYGFNIRFCKADGTLVASKYIRVTQEDKPVYRASVTFDKLFYRFGETVTATLTASFFDGTPASGLRFRASAYGPFAWNGEVVTGIDGRATISIKTTPYSGSSSTYPLTIYISAELMGYETTSLSVSGSALYFHSDVQFRAARIDGNYSEVYLNKTDTSKLKTEADLSYPNFPANIYGESASGSVRVALCKREYTQVSTGTYYDPITKTTYQNYSTYSSDTEVKSYAADFVNGKLRLDHMEVEGFRGYYYYLVSYYDAKNNATYTETVYAVKHENRVYNYDSWYGYDITADKDAYTVGDKVTVSYLYQNQPVSGRILYTLYDSNGFVTQTVREGSYGFTFTDSMALFCRVYAVVLDGSKYQVSSESVSYDCGANNTLNIEILPDSASYAPGQRASVKLKVTDQNGKPVSGTVLLAVVDEACFALGDQSLSPVGAYFTSAGGSGVTPYYYAYSKMYYDYGYYYGYRMPIVTLSIDTRFDIFREVAFNNVNDYLLDTGYYSTADSIAAPAAEKEAARGSSSEASVYIRENFSDNPVFEAIKLGVDGVAVASFTVPDNITEWRLSALAFGNIGAAKVTERALGSSTTGVICTLPYFINVSSCNYYIEGDDVTVSARSYGTALLGVGSVTYNAEISDGSGKSIGKKKVEGKTGEYAWFNFGSLPTGSYSVTVTASCGSYTDGVKATFNVVRSGSIVDVRRDVTVSEIKSLAPLTYPLTLSFYNAGYDKYLGVVNQIRRDYSGTRSDAMAAYYVVLAASEKLFGSDGKEGLDEIKSTLSAKGSGLIPLLDYSAGDIALTAKICAVAPEALAEYRKSEIISALNAYVAGKSADSAELSAAYLGLAALGEPVLDRLYHVASNSASFTTEAKLYLAAALAYIGDFSAANELYTLVRTGAVAEAEGGELYIRGSDTEESIKLTSLALLSASRLSRADAGKMARYLGTHTSSSEYYGLELATYVKYFMPTEKVDATLSYRFGNGEVQKVEIPAGGAYVLRLTKTGFDSLEILEADSNVRVRAAYGGSPADALDGTQKTGELTVIKTITPYDVKAGLYMVTLNFSGKTDRDHISFNISDCIPTGARFVSSVYNDGKFSVSGGRYGGAWIGHTGGQQMSGYIYIWSNYSTKWNEKTAEYSFSGSVSYIIRGAVTGNFIAEEALVRNRATGNYAVSDRMYITIGDGEWVVKVIK